MSCLTIIIRCWHSPSYAWISPNAAHRLYKLKSSKCKKQLAFTFHLENGCRSDGIKPSSTTSKLAKSYSSVSIFFFPLFFFFPIGSIHESWVVDLTSAQNGHVNPISNSESSGRSEALSLQRNLIFITPVRVQGCKVTLWINKMSLRLWFGDKLTLAIRLWILWQKHHTTRGTAR